MSRFRYDITSMGHPDANLSWVCCHETSALPTNPWAASPGGTSQQAGANPAVGSRTSTAVALPCRRAAEEGACKRQGLILAITRRRGREDMILIF